MQRILLFLVAFAACTEAQTPRPQLSAVQVQQYEAALKSNPGDRAARSALLDYYFLNSGLDARVAIAARRRHILWLIENTPSDQLAGTSAATIDAAGHRLADPQGFKLASDAWRAQTAKADISAAALAATRGSRRQGDRLTLLSGLGLELLDQRDILGFRRIRKRLHIRPYVRQLLV
jgi:hypothetical protein